MSIADGFNMWIGKMLAGLAIVAVIFAALFAGIVLFVFAKWLQKRLRRK
jgi:hypothetical protein